MRIGLKLWSTNDWALEPTRSLRAKQMFDYIELYVVPGTLDTIQRWKELGGSYILHAAHSLGGLNMAEPGVVGKNAPLFEELDEFRSALSADKIVFHPGIDGDLADTAANFADLRRKYPAIADTALVENKPSRGLNGEQCLGATPDEIKRIMTAGDGGFCLDFGHAIAAANALDMDWKNLVESFMEIPPSLFHLSDGDITADIDAHLNLGDGSYPIADIAETIPVNARITLETAKSPSTFPNDFQRDVLEILAAGNSLPDNIRLRTASWNDCETILRMANSPDVRAVSFSSEIIDMPTHEKWFKAKLETPNAFFIIAEDANTAEIAAQIRFETTNGDWTISISLNREFRGKGLGVRLIETASAIFFDRHPETPRILAYIKPENKASIRAFEKAGYKYAGTASVKRKDDATLMEIHP
jgi:RimJ/RimL family protein N-acetyltransferase/endonuclease IV